MVIRPGPITMTLVPKPAVAKRKAWDGAPTPCLQGMVRAGAWECQLAAYGAEVDDPPCA
jgi:hypothetical protein